MSRSPFTFYRGSALAMAQDLAVTPSSGIRVQCCGDAHLSNFGGFATPERRVLFSINDLDETLPAPWEWDVKRLAASFVLGCRDNGLKDALFLQVKEARASVLEPYAGKSAFANQGQRVVHGYRMMQPASDLFLGWSSGPRRHFFVRQLRDIKISLRVETFGPTEMDIYATWCGRALALSHARSGSAAMLSGYMGKSDVLDKAIGAFSMAYADQSEKDHALLDRAVKDGTLEAEFEEDRA
jgi:hypothetical protein